MELEIPPFGKKRIVYLHMECYILHSWAIGRASSL